MSSLCISPSKRKDNTIESSQNRAANPQPLSAIVPQSSVLFHSTIILTLPHLHASISSKPYQHQTNNDHRPSTSNPSRRRNSRIIQVKQANRISLSSPPPVLFIYPPAQEP